MNFEQQIIDLNQKVFELTVQIDNLHRFTVPQRLACDLKKVCEQNSLNPERFELPLTKTRLAHSIGIEHETLSRTIPKMAEYGISISGKVVEFTDKPRTQRTVCDDCAGRDACRAFKYVG
jgi:CRP-like cAMP-binding protein